MPDQTNDELRRDIAEKLRASIVWGGDERWEDVEQRILALADALQPKPPEPKLIHWAVAQHGTSPFCRSFDVPEGVDVWKILDDYADGNLISTANLPELEEDEEYTGEYREPLYYERFLGTNGKVLEKRVPARIGMAFIVRRKEATNA